MFQVKKNPSAQDVRRFGWAMLLGFGVLGVIAWLVAWRVGSTAGLLSWSGERGQVSSIVLWGLGVALWGVSLLTPVLGRAVYVVWMSAASIVGVLMTTVLLTLLFLFFLPLFSLVVRYGDPLRKKLKAEGSYWEDYRPHESTLERMRRLF
jgi:hypothetical protein